MGLGIKCAQRVLKHVAKDGDLFRIECVAVQQLPDGHGRNSCLRQLGREPVGLPHHCRAANDVRDINILPIRQQEKFLNDRCPET
jgi:tRNA(Leu) C34 or U34 (ribose-2'-O)-methylase TrmL